MCTFLEHRLTKYWEDLLGWHDSAERLGEIPIQPKPWPIRMTCYSESKLSISLSHTHIPCYFDGQTTVKGRWSSLSTAGPTFHCSNSFCAASPLGLSSVHFQQSDRSVKKNIDTYRIQTVSIHAVCVYLSWSSYTTLILALWDFMKLLCWDTNFTTISIVILCF